MTKNDGICQCCCFVGRWMSIFALCMRHLKPLACSLSRRTGRTGVLVVLGYQETGVCEDKAVLSLFKLILNVTLQAIHCLARLAYRMKRRCQSKYIYWCGYDPDKVSLYIPMAADETPTCLKGIFSIC